MNEFERLKQSELAKHVNLAEWRAGQFHPLDLPSGLKVIVRDVDMTDLLLTGLMPPSIIDMAEKAAEAEKAEVDLQEIGSQVMSENREDFLSFLNAITRASLAYPAVVDDVAETDDDHIALSEIKMVDKTAIMEWVNRGAEQIRPFRDGEDEPVAAVQPGDGLRKKAK